MTQKTFELIAGVLFGIVALLHFFRIAHGWNVTIGTWIVPMWVSWLGLVIPAVLAYYGVKLGSHTSRKL
jgi:hypothetical protein